MFLNIGKQLILKQDLLTIMDIFLEDWSNGPNFLGVIQSAGLKYGWTNLPVTPGLESMTWYNATSKVLTRTKKTKQHIIK